MATVNRRGRTWQLNWSDADGQHRVSLGPITKQEAEIVRREKELELLTGRRVSGSAVTLAEFAVDYLAWYSTQYPSTYDRTEGIIRLQLLPRFGNEPLDAIQPGEVTRWVAVRSQQIAPASVTKEVRVLRAMLNKAVQWRVIGEFPLVGYQAPPERASKAVEFYSSEQLAALYLAAGPVWAPVWQFMANTGLRRNEALNLKLSDVMADRVRVESTDDKPTKSRKWRDVPLNARAMEAVGWLRGKRQEGFLLPQVFPRSVSRAFEKAALRASLGGSLHTLRHTFVSHLVMAGVDLETVRRIAGHSTITTTLKYAHLAPGHLTSAVTRIAL